MHNQQRQPHVSTDTIDTTKTRRGCPIRTKKTAALLLLFHVAMAH
jgi:hypothetical protein